MIENVPLAQRRGYETSDVNQLMFLVLSPIKQVAQVFSQVRQVASWERDVYEREIEIQGHSYIVFQLRGHFWTLICQLSALARSIPLEDQDMQSLSSLLHTKALRYQVSDTSLTIGYHLYDCGESIEQLYYTSDEIDIDEDIDEDDDENEDDDDIGFGTCQFRSQIRQLQAEDIIQDPYGYVHEFLCEQDAYVPSVYSKAYFEQGKRYILRLRDIDYNDVERMDYVVLS